MERISSEAMLRFVERLEREDVCLHGFELRQDGEIRAEGYYAPFAKGQPHRMYSVSKSMVALALGLLLGEGRLRLTDHIVDFFPEALPAAPDPRLLRMTIEDMLRMTTCYRRTTYREGVDRDWAATFFRGDCTHEPGTLFHYDTSCTQVLGALCQRVSGQGLLELLEERIFHPIGATDPKRWLTDPSGVPQGGTGLIMSLRDLGKTAQLVMDGGRGLLPESFLRSATAKQVDTTVQGNPEERFGYVGSTGVPGADGPCMAWAVNWPWPVRRKVCCYAPLPIPGWTLMAYSGSMTPFLRRSSLPRVWSTTAMPSGWSGNWRPCGWAAFPAGRSCHGTSRRAMGWVPMNWAWRRWICARER